MDSIWKRECSSASEIENVFKYPKNNEEISDVANMLQETNIGSRSTDDEESEKEESLDSEESQSEHKPGALEVNREICVTCERSGMSRMLRRRLMLDAVMISPPKISHSSAVPQGPMVEDNEEHIMVNTKALPKEARTYELEKFERNCLIIFNQETVDGFEPRLGTKEDVNILTETFESYGFDVVEHKDFTKDKIIEVLETLKTTNFTEYGCVGIVVLTHGSFNGLLRAKDQAYSETEIIKYFRVYDKPTLVTKPKLLIIQACRGTRCLPGVPVMQLQSGRLKKDLGEELEPYTLPVMSDMLVVHSSYIGEASTRDELHGSWFIQTLCRKIKDMSPSHDLESILTEVKREVAADRHWEDYNRLTREVDVYKQMPTVTSTLIRKLYLKKFGDESPPTSFLDASVPMPSRDPVLDTAITPLLVQFGPCSCFLSHFEYIKKCLMFFLEENPNDSTARTFLEISNAFENETQFNAAKERMAKAISDYLSHNARHCDYFKYLYFYKH